MTLSIYDTTIYAGGNFTSIGGEARNYIAALDATTGMLTDWNPNLGGLIENPSGASVGWIIKSGEWDEIDPFNPDSMFQDAIKSVDPMVLAIMVHDSTVYIGGRFSTVGNQTRNNIAAIDIETGYATDWNPVANDIVMIITNSDSTIIAGGSFTNIGYQTRNHIAELSIETGNATSWNPNANERVMALDISNSIVYAGGGFTYIGGESRSLIAAIELTTGDATDWDPNITGYDAEVKTITVSGSEVYVGGDFSYVDGEARNNIAAIDVETGRPTSWDPSITGGYPGPRVYQIVVSEPIIYAAGGFSYVSQKPRNSIAALNIETGEALDWDPNPLYPGIPLPGEVYSLAVSESFVDMGGFFTEVKDKVQPYFATVTADEVTVISTSVNIGWQLVSVPVVVEDYSADSIFPTVTSLIYAYVPGTGYVAKDTLDNGPGYWTQFGSAQTLIHTGLIIDTLSIGIESGWNIIGSISYNVRASEICTEPSGIISSIFKYDNQYIPLGDGAFIEPGVGYWVNANASGNVILSESCGMQKITSYPQLNLSEMDKFIITDSNEKEQSLYVANIDIDSTVENFDRRLPPPIPALEFDARFNYGEFIKAVSIDSGVVDLEIDVESIAYPVTLSWEINPENAIEYSFISDSGLGKITQISVENGQAKFNENSRGSIQLFGKVNESFKLIQIPEKFELLQNYPNPFNPTTTIKYSLPKDGLVSLTVYNAIGERVVELVNEEVKAGYYEVVFDASSLSSGVYFYQIVAGKYMDAKKMILLK